MSGIRNRTAALQAGSRAALLCNTLSGVHLDAGRLPLSASGLLCFCWRTVGPVALTSRYYWPYHLFPFLVASTNYCFYPGGLAWGSQCFLHHAVVGNFCLRNRKQYHYTTHEESLQETRFGINFVFFFASRLRKTGLRYELICEFNQN